MGEKKDSLDGNEKDIQKITKIKTHPVKFSLGEIKENITINAHVASKEQILNQAFRFHSQGNISKAAKYYQQFIDKGFYDAMVFSNYGVICKQIGQIDKAINLFKKAIEVDSGLAIAHANLGNTLTDIGKLEEAEISQRKAIELKPDYSTAFADLGKILIELERFEEAEVVTRKAIKLKPDFALAYLNLGKILIELERLEEAEVVTRKAIRLNSKFVLAYSNLGSILMGLERLEEAEVVTRKAIRLNPNFASAYSILGSILIDLGKLSEAKTVLLKALELNNVFSKVYFTLSNLDDSKDKSKWKDKLFLEDILKNKSQKDYVDIYFARANILHKENNYEESAKYLKLANKIKLDIKPSKSKILIKKSKSLLLECDKQENVQKEYSDVPESIFIVGMPRSGSTLLDSILSMNSNVNDLGEINLIEELFIEWKRNNRRYDFFELYLERMNDLNNLKNITTNKNLYNYQYSGIISKNIKNAKIIHCYRNPLDNILSIYRAHFTKGNEYSSSLADCAEVYLDHEKIMTEYKNRYRLKIYDLNYDLLVTNPNQEIKSLIDWLGWEWQNSYLSPHLNPRSVSTASSVQVRSPISSKSIGGWKNYSEMLEPAIKVLKNYEKYKNCNFN